VAQGVWSLVCVPLDLDACQQSTRVNNQHTSSAHAPTSPLLSLSPLLTPVPPQYYGAAASNVKLITVFPGSMLTNFARNTIPGG
jgi:hypothetical protein